jgi:hypothetical protein
MLIISNFIFVIFYLHTKKQIAIICLFGQIKQSVVKFNVERNLSYHA